MIPQMQLMALAAMTSLATAAGPGTAQVGPTAQGQSIPKAGNSTGAAAAAAPQKSDTADSLNKDFTNYIFIVLTSLIVALTIWRVVIESSKYVRTTACLNNDSQAYFAVPGKTWAVIKKNILYAPVISKRHNREIQLSSAVNVGTLPTRFQLIFLILYFGTNVAYCVVSINWHGQFKAVAGELRNRAGILAVSNMIPLFIMAGRNNPLIKLLNLSFDTFNLLHRWQGRIVVLEALVHFFSWMAATVSAKGRAGIWPSIQNSQFKMWGFIAICAFVFISIQANSIVRHAFYETFKYLHIASAILVVIAISFHLRLIKIPQLSLLYGVIGCWALDNLIRLTILAYRNFGNRGNRTLVEALPDNACRVTISLARPWTFKPGQHAYLHMPTIGPFQSHPFSVAWSEEAEVLDAEKLASNRQDVLETQKTTMSFVIRARTGFTAKLCKKAETSPGGKFYTKCFAEGPYGGMHMMHSYGTVMLFAGGVGITHQVPHVRDLVAGYANGTVATRKIVLVWVIQSPDHLEWIRSWMTAILAMDKRRDCLRIMLFVSRPHSNKEIQSPSATVQMFPGRPNIETLIDAEIGHQVGAMGVSVCGPGALSDDVRRAVRMRQHVRNIDFVEEAFSW